MRAIVILKTRVFGFDFFTQFYEINKKIVIENPFYSGKVQNYHYKIAAGVFPGRLVKIGSKFFGIDLSVMDLIAQQDGSPVSQIEIPINMNWIDEVSHMLINGSADLSVLPGLIIPIDPFLKLINTYDENAYCALVPLPSQLTFLHFVLKPFDDTSWIFLITTTAASAFVFFRITKSFKLAQNFIFFVIGGFLGQFVALKVNKNILAVILILFVFTTFILGNAYQSLIISNLISSRDGIRVKTFEELFRHTDLTFMTDVFFKSVYKKSEDALQFRMEVFNLSFTFSDIIGENKAVIATCEQLSYFFYSSSDQDLAVHFYFLPERIMRFYEKIYLAFGSAFYDHLQLQHDRIYESGLRQHLLRQFMPTKFAQHKREKAYIENERYLLTLEDVGGIFLVLLTGHGVALLALLLENLMENLKFVGIILKKKIQSSQTNYSEF